MGSDLAASSLQSQLLTRCFDGVYREKIFETWVSAKVRGPKFFPGDTRENRLFFDQFFVVDVADGRSQVTSARSGTQTPADDPKYVIHVMLDFDKRAPYHQGGNSAGPIWRRIAMLMLGLKEPLAVFETHA